MVVGMVVIVVGMVVFVSEEAETFFSHESCSAFLFLFSLPNNLELVGSVSYDECKKTPHLLRGFYIE